MHPALMLNLEHLAVAWLLISVVAALVWAVDAVRDDFATFDESRWERHTPEPPRITLIDAALTGVYDQDNDVA